MTDQITTKPGDKYRSIKNPRVYEALRREGYDKTAAARISNAQAKRKRTKTCMDCVLASLKGEQIAPGITRIRGNLCNVHGRYGPCDAAASGKKKPAKGKKPRAPVKPKPTPEQRAAARTQAQQQQRDAQRKSVIDQMANSDTGLAPASAQALLDFNDGKNADPAMVKGLAQAGLVEIGNDGQPRLTASGRMAAHAIDRGDYRGAVDAVSKGTDQRARQQERDQKRAAAEAERAKRAAAKKKPAGGADKAGIQRAMGQIGQAAPPKMRTGARAKKKPPRRKRTPVSQGGPRRMPQTTTKAGDPGDYLVVEDREKPSTWHLQVKKNGTPDHRLMGAAWAALHGGYRGNTYQGPNKQQALSKLRALYASEKMPLPSEKSFAVFKDTAGAWRWIARTTTAYEDRDQEVISTKALDDSAASAAPRGPLRWWHMGRPDPLDSAQPWGPGVDLGWCDFAAMSGKTLIESGTFKSEPIARAVAAHQSDLELSPGFFHAAGEPDSSGVFHHIRIFERSLVPKWAGRASNPYTGLIVEKTMDQKKIQALKDLGASDEVITALLADVQQTEKSAEADGVRYKDTPLRDLFVRLLKGESEVTTKAAPEPPVEEVAPADPLAELMATVKALQAEVASLKAAPTLEIAEEKQGMGGMGDMMPDAETPMEDTAEGGMEEPADTGDGGLTLSADDLGAIGQVIGQVLSSAMEPLIGALGITQKLEGHLGELKTMMSGYTKTKDDAQAAIVAKVDQVEAKVAELSGDLPRQGYRASQSPENTVQALVTAATLKDGATPTDDSPFADLVEKLFGQQR